MILVGIVLNRGREGVMFFLFICYTYVEGKEKEQGKAQNFSWRFHGISKSLVLVCFLP